MLAVHGISIVVQIIVPLVLLGWCAWSRSHSRLGWAFGTAVTGVFIVAVWVGGLWLVAPWYTPALWLLLLLAIVTRRWRETARLPWWPAPPAGSARLGLAAAATSASLLLLGYLLAGLTPPSDTVELAFPLAGGTYLVVAGGGVMPINPHLQTLTNERFHDYRGQSYGVDIVRIHRSGLRASGILPSDPGRYAIFGDAVYATCGGHVVYAEDGARDMPPPTADRTHMAGNHVLLACGDVHVLLAHLQKGSVRVRPGDTVGPGSVLGLVGNSGNTNEPHLHIHAQRPSPERAVLAGDPVPIRFGGRYAVRNSVFAPRAPASSRADGE